MPSRGGLSYSAPAKLGPCQVRSKTARPCPRPASVEILGVPFCEACACEQETYFAIGELTEEAHNLRNGRLSEMLVNLRRRDSNVAAAETVPAALRVGARE